MESRIKTIIENASDSTISVCIIDSYKEVERNYFIKSWKTSELDAGHFVESVRRFIEFNLFQQYTPLGTTLPRFDANTMQRYQNAPGDKSYRIHIPRALLTIYGIRNNRGVGHLSSIEANYLDATFIISTVKWVLAEIIRLNSSYTADETIKMVEFVVERPIEGIWENSEITRILVDNLKIKEQVMFLLHSTKKKNDEDLRQVIESSNKTYFKKILRSLHKDRFIEYKNDGQCIITPKGIKFAENIILQKINN